MTEYELDRENPVLKNHIAENNADHYAYSKILKLFLIQKKHKEVNNMIHIYQHRVNKYIEPITSKKQHQDQLNPSLPKINKHEQNKSSSGPKQKLRIKSNQSLNKTPKFNFEEERAKADRVKELLKVNKEKKQKEAKDQREALRMARENIQIFREKLKLENKQKKKLVEFKHQLMKNSIVNYQVMKKEYIDGLINKDIENEMNEVFKRQSELAYLRVTHEQNLNKMRQGRSLMNLHQENLSPINSCRINEQAETLSLLSKKDLVPLSENSGGMFLTGVENVVSCNEIQNDE